MPFLDPSATGECEFRSLVEKIETACDIPDVPHFTYRLSQTENNCRRRVIWVPLGGRPVDQTTDLGALTLGNGISVEWLYEEALEVEARITGGLGNPGDDDSNGFEDAELIRRNVIAAFSQVMREQGRKLEVGPHTWQTQQENAAAHLHGGAETVVQQFTFVQPVPKRTLQTVTLTNSTHTCGYVDTLP